MNLEPGKYSLEEAAELGIYDPISGHVISQEGYVIFKACSGACSCTEYCAVHVRVKR